MRESPSTPSSDATYADSSDVVARGPHDPDANGPPDEPLSDPRNDSIVDAQWVAPAAWGNHPRGEVVPEQSETLFAGTLTDEGPGSESDVESIHDAEVVRPAIRPGKADDERPHSQPAHPQPIRWQPAVLATGSTPSLADAAVHSEPGDATAVPPRPGWLRRIGGGLSWILRGLFEMASWITLIALLSAIPVVQVLAFGYLIRVAGNLARGGTLREAIPHRHAAGRLGLALVFTFLAAIPSRLFANYESIASIVDPGSGRATLMRVMAWMAAVGAIAYLGWAWTRGGRLVHYLWPQPKRLLHTAWRPSTWTRGLDQILDGLLSLQIPSTFSLGLRGVVGTLVWLMPAMVIVAAFRRGETGLAGLVGAVALILLAVVMHYLPMLQVQFAADRNWRSLFAVRRVRQNFRAAPWSHAVALTLGLIVLPVPLYLLKIEATPQEVVWLPCLMFVGFMLPARMVEGLAYRRGQRMLHRIPERTGWRRLAWRGSLWVCRGWILVVVFFYLLMVYLSQYISWDGLDTWVSQHAVLLPIPFLRGT